MVFSLSYPYWFILICLLVAAGFTAFMYAKKRKAYPTRIFYLLATLRFIVVFILSFLLLSPILRYLSNTTEKPVIVFMQDNSASIKHAFRKSDSVAYRNNVNALVKELSKDYEVKRVSFGNTLIDSLPFSYTEKATDLSAALDKVMNTYANVNLGAVILASDGIYNQGNSPLSEVYPFKGTLFSVGLGDTTIQKDVLVARLFANKTVYLGDKFAIRSDIAAYSCEGNTVSISIFDHSQNRVIASQSARVEGQRFSRSIESVLDANSPGIRHYTVSVTKIDGEQNTLNNSQDVYVEVLDNKENVLIVANAPHPDINALREALSKNKNYKVDVQMAGNASARVNDYNLLVLHNIPSAGYNAASMLDQAAKAGISTWFIVGGQTAIPIFNKVQSALQVAASGSSGNDVQALVNNDFSYFTINAAYANAIPGLPPLYAPFGKFSAGANTQVLMSQKIGSIASNYPLWVLQSGAGARTAVLAGEGLWRWRFYDFNQRKNHETVDDFILKTAQYLSVKHDKKQFRTQLPKFVFSESEAVLLDAELYNENYELINTPEVSVALSDEGGKRTVFSMNKNSNSYSLNLGNLAAGKYSYTASTTFNGRSFSSGGNFQVVYQDLESVQTTADFASLQQLARSYSGEFVFANDVSSLAERIRKHKQVRNILRSETRTEPLIDWKWLFALLIICMGAEWYLRKTQGQY